MSTITSPLCINTLSNSLVVQFPQVYRCLSWAPWNGGETLASAVVNRHVDLHVSSASGTIAEGFERLFREISLVPDETIGLMTAANVDAYHDCFLVLSGAWVHAVATTGLSNARSVLDDADVELGYRCGSAGTVNLVVATNALPTIEGRIQAIHIAASAKTAAFRDTRSMSRKSDRPADLTGTDCIVVGASGEITEDQCGLHTVLGEMIGRAAYMVVSRGISELSNP
ncbi:MAG: adenosylcobinamide amidohydrolase [Nitrospirales bacterium]